MIYMIMDINCGPLQLGWKALKVDCLYTTLSVHQCAVGCGNCSTYMLSRWHPCSSDPSYARNSKEQLKPITRSLTTHPRNFFRYTYKYEFRVICSGNTSTSLPPSALVSDNTSHCTSDATYHKIWCMQAAPRLLLNFCP